MEFSPKDARSLPFKRLASWVRDVQIDPSALDNLTLAFANGASPNARSSELGQNLLSYACSRGAWSAAIFLLDAGASPLPFSGGPSSPQIPSLASMGRVPANLLDEQPVVPLPSTDFSARNHPLMAALAFLKSSQQVRHTQWHSKNAPASEAATILDPEFEAFLDRWLEAGGELTPAKASSMALREVFSTPVFAMAHAFIARNLRLDHLEQDGFSPLAALARSRGTRAIGLPREGFLSERPALRQCVANLGAQLIEYGADCEALLSISDGSHQPSDFLGVSLPSPGSSRKKRSDFDAPPKSLTQLFSGPDAERIPGFDAYVRERLLSSYESREMLFHMRKEAYGDSLFGALDAEPAASLQRRASPRI